jgi:hypothetical protein
MEEAFGPSRFVNRMVANERLSIRPERVFGWTLI